MADQKTQTPPKTEDKVYAPASLGMVGNAPSPTVATADLITKHLSKLAEGGIPQVEDFAHESIDQAFVGFPTELRKIGEERGLTFCCLDSSLILSHRLIVSKAVVPINRTTFPEAESYLGPDGYMRQMDGIWCVGRKEIADRVMANAKERADKINASVSGRQHRAVGDHDRNGNYSEGYIDSKLEVLNRP